MLAENSRLTDAARLSLVFRSRFCNWKSALFIAKPETLMASARVQAVMEVEVAPGQTVPYQRRTNRLTTYGTQGNRLLENYPVRCRVRLGVLPRLKTSRSRLASTPLRDASNNGPPPRNRPG